MSRATQKQIEGGLHRWMILDYSMKNWVGRYVRIASDRRGFVVVRGCAELSRRCALPNVRFYRVRLAMPNMVLWHTHMLKGIGARVQQTVTKSNSIHVSMLSFLRFDNSEPV